MQSETENEVAEKDAQKTEEKANDETNTKFVIVNNSTVHKYPYCADLSRKLLRIEYPGIVENVDRMIETLGGMRSIETAVGNYNRRLELRFRPEDLFSKPCWGDKDYDCGILVKITMRQPKPNASVPSCSKSKKVESEEAPTYSYNVIGLTAMNFTFNRLCDFQYLPLVTTAKQETSDTPCHYIYEDIIPNKLPDMKWLESEEGKSMPLFFPPPLFTKFNSSKENKLYFERYKYYEKVIPEVAERLKKDFQKKKQEPENFIGHSRFPRKANSIFIKFNVKDVSVPLKPNEQALDTVKKRGFQIESFDKIKQLFEERPIWSKTAILHRSGVRKDRLKAILPAVAYHFPNGPWRIMWCKFGYDPRKDPSSRIYQTFDFRVRESGCLKVKVQAKRSYSSTMMHYKGGAPSTEKFSLKNCSAQDKNPKPPEDETAYTLKPGCLPPARQMFYQYCDLHLPEIQEMLNRLPKIRQDMKFHPKNGWLPNGFHNDCREIANKYVTQHVQSLLLEDKQKEDEEKSKFVDKAKSNNKTSTAAEIQESIVDTIVIDDDDDDDDFGGAGDDIDANNELSDSDDDRREDMEDYIESAVDDISNIIANIGEPSSQSSNSNSNENEDSCEEFDPELIELYKQLISSNADINM